MAASDTAAPCGSVMVPRNEAADWESPMAGAMRASKRENLSDERRRVISHLVGFMNLRERETGSPRRRFAAPLRHTYGFHGGLRQEKRNPWPALASMRIIKRTTSEVKSTADRNFLLVTTNK